MIVEKPEWLRHEGLQIFSVDFQPSGQRCATAGGDHKVRIWNTRPLMKEGEADRGGEKLLATLCDHFGSVNCVRWSKSGLYVASGSDGSLVLIHEKRHGTGTVEFGSGEPANVENWKVCASLRGHTADVVDLAWSPDDSMLATCSLDNTVRIWKMPGGSSVAVLTGHSSLVKGVAWDPIGSFLASQSDDKTVMIWQTSDWAAVHRAEGPWRKSVGSTFFRRLSWSPCGHFIITTHGYENPSHTAQVLERGDWSGTFNFVGHNAPVVAVRFNHSMFRKQPLPPPENNGEEELLQMDPKKVPKEMVPYNVVAMGSQDRNITVWTTANPRPVFVGKHFFTQSVVDLSWSPDGYSLFCCSLDGTVASFHFEAKELGHIVSEKEMEEFRRNRYGDSRSRQESLAESPAQLFIEATAAAKKVGNSTTIVSNGNTTSNVSNTTVVTQTNKQVASTTLRAQEHEEAGTTTTVTTPKNGTLEKDQAAAVAVAAAPLPPPPAKQTPVKQREYRQQDGRRRIIPEALHTEDDGGRKDRESSAEKRKLSPVDASKSEAPSKRLLGSGGSGGGGGGGGVRERNGSGASKAIEVSSMERSLGLSSTTNTTVAINVTQASQLRGPDGVLSVQVRISDEESLDGPAVAPICLEAKPVRVQDAAAGRGETGETDLVCSQGGEIRWRDRFAGKVTALTGNTNFWAVGCEDGSLQVYTMAGRRALPSMVVGSAAAFMDCTRGWELLLLTRGGTMHVWDLRQSQCLLNESLLPLTLSSSATSSAKESGVMRIISARFSEAGAPLVVLANGHAFLFHTKMRSWLRIADDFFPSSSFVSTWPPSGDGELAGLQKGAATLGKTNFSWNRTLINEKYQTRAHLEDQLAAALALKSAEEYKRHLISYTRFLTREADEVRLRELCEDLLGPLFVPDSEPCYDSQPTTSTWESYVLGMKKRELLKNEVLPAMASNRAVQRLLNEFLDMLSEYEDTQ
ncbi:protein HIRA isoform X1 [Selaginella moellendorffii]|uniref:protein HIRA isoform X1 n=2 Tax=Selaginella moellendorffii TaxID=88036 RepID=UPI000D1C6BA8|nr:protein HIRA isoform X1 [Selaginella moellendorffii]|eukprot:XP_024539552.1 protein HIRA isoform X1 [Selaginella moellendorffii]